VARTALAGRALVLQPQGLAVVGALGDGNLDCAPVREGDALAGALDGLFQVDLQPGADVGAALRAEAAEAEAAAGAGAPAAAARPERRPQDVGRAGVLDPGALAASPGPAITPAEAAHGLPPVGVDLAGVEPAALIGVAQEVERGADPLELLFR